MKKIFVLLLLILVISSISFGDVNMSIYFNNHFISFDNDPIVLKDDFLVPMNEFFELIGAQYSYNDETKIITAYRDNMFIKLSIGSQLGFKNGKSFPLQYTPQFIDEVIYLPLSFIADAFSVAYEYDETKNTLHFNNYSILIYKTYINYFYETVEIPEYNINFDIPYYWELLDEKNNTYGIQNEFENNTVTCYAFKETGNITIEDYLFTLKEYTINFYQKGAFTIIEEKEYLASGFKGNFIAFQYDFFEDSIVHAYFVTKADDVFYVFKFQFNQEDSLYLFTIIENIINSFEIQSFAISTEEEHYVEFPRMFSTNMTLDNEIYSNMQVKNFLEFKGTIEPNINNLLIEVCKNKETLSFNIPVDNGVFTGKIYLPFGLGRHNIVVKVNPDSDEIPNSELINLKIDSNILIKFSIINISPEFIRYTVPDEPIISNHTHINSMANFLTYELLSDYAKTYKLFTYMLEHISVRNEILNNDPYEVYINLEGNEQGVTNYFASLLRSVGIPTRVYRGMHSLVFHSWTEVYLNGKWYIIDPSFAILSQEAGNPNNYFIVQAENYQQHYEVITELTK